MLCKASIMGDVESFKKISEETKADKVTALGRAVKPWDSDKWNENVLAVAEAVQFQKFKKVYGLNEDL